LVGQNPENYLMVGWREGFVNPKNRIGEKWAQNCEEKVEIIVNRAGEEKKRRRFPEGP
jgi:hypothetical protein